MTPRQTILAALGLALGLSLPASAAAPESEDAGVLARAFAAISARDWQVAIASGRESGALSADLVAWHALRAGNGSLAEYADFAARNADWPGMPLLRERAEAQLTEATPAAAVLAWFGDEAPVTANGARQLLRALAPEDAAVRAAAIRSGHAASATSTV